MYIHRHQLLFSYSSKMSLFHKHIEKLKYPSVQNRRLLCSLKSPTKNQHMMFCQLTPIFYVNETIQKHKELRFPSIYFLQLSILQLQSFTFLHYTMFPLKINFSVYSTEEFPQYTTFYSLYTVVLPQ